MGKSFYGLIVVLVVYYQLIERRDIKKRSEEPKASRRSIY